LARAQRERLGCCRLFTSRNVSEEASNKLVKIFQYLFILKLVRNMHWLGQRESLDMVIQVLTLIQIVVSALRRILKEEILQLMQLPKMIMEI
jgi:hypothetical protein